MNAADTHAAPAPDGAERRRRGGQAAFAAATPAVSAQSLTLVWTAGFLAGSRWKRASAKVTGCVLLDRGCLAPAFPGDAERH